MDKLLDEFYLSTRVSWSGPCFTFEGVGSNNRPMYIEYVWGRKGENGENGENGVDGCRGERGTTGDPELDERQRIEDEARQAKEAEEKLQRQAKCEALARGPHTDLPVPDAIGLYISFPVDAPRVKEAYAAILAHLETTIGGECELSNCQAPNTTTTTFTKLGSLKAECKELFDEMTAKNLAVRREYDMLLGKLVEIGVEVYEEPTFEYAKNEWYEQDYHEKETKTDGTIYLKCHKGTAIYQQLLTSGWLHRSFPTRWRSALITP